MTKTKYWLSILAISVVLIAGSLAVSPVAIADDDDDDDDDNEIVITGTTGDDKIQVFEFLVAAIRCKPLCTVTGPVTDLGEEEFGGFFKWTINPGAGNGVDDEYRINGNGGTDDILFFDGISPDDDKVEIENTAGILKVLIVDTAGDDEYNVKGSSGDIVTYEDGLGDDVFEFEG